MLTIKCNSRVVVGGTTVKKKQVVFQKWQQLCTEMFGFAWERVGGGSALGNVMMEGG